MRGFFFHVNFLHSLFSHEQCVPLLLVFMMSELVPPNPDVPGNTPNPTQPPPTPKRPLESASAEFLEKGWGLLQEVHSKKEYPFASVKSMNIGEPKGMYTAQHSTTQAHYTLVQYTLSLHHHTTPHHTTPAKYYILYTPHTSY
jgi:hypothetical protein